MKQTGTFYTLTNNENSAEVKKPFPNIFLYFSQGGVRKLTTQTNADGKFDFDLPFGNYNVTMSVGANSSVFTLAGGSEFSLTSSSKVNAFEQWAMIPVYLKPEENPLVIRLNELVQISVNAATEAKAIQDELNSNSTGTGNFARMSEVNKKADITTVDVELSKKWDIQETIGSGKIMREGAAGWGSATTPDVVGIGTLTRNVNGFYAKGGIHEIVGYPFRGATAFTTQGVTQSGTIKVHTAIEATNSSGLAKAPELYMFTSINGASHALSRFYSDRNTTVDSNGFIKAASPIIKLFNDRIETNDQFYDEPIFSKIGVGTYKISNTKGLSKEGWSYEKPRGGDGAPYFRIEVTKLEDGCIISVHDEYDSLEEATITDINGNTRTINKVVKVLGEARDIKPNERWVDLRFEEDHERIKAEEQEAQRQMLIYEEQEKQRLALENEQESSEDLSI